MEEITPTLKRLKEERTLYLEYRKVMREVEHLSRLSVAFQFVQAEVQLHEIAYELFNYTELLHRVILINAHHTLPSIDCNYY